MPTLPLDPAQHSRYFHGNPVVSLPADAAMASALLPSDAQLIREAISALMRKPDPQRPGQAIGGSKAGIYAFYDYDREPIYVGQTTEGFAIRLGRHLISGRSDAVTKSILDPFEIREVALWSLPHIGDLPVRQRKAALDPYEYTVFDRLVRESSFHALLNEAFVPPSTVVDLPDPLVGVIIPDEVFPGRNHPDVRIARRVQTMSQLAKFVCERKVSLGLRRTLATQALRLEEITRRRVNALTQVNRHDGFERGDLEIFEEEPEGSLF
ncbi:GIY-YIG nuclease family protein [Micromonospora chalcea]|uniref:GIY-YIG nuclease family protein n=1 Tax=Micromonospora sp. TSRI0369 TaxID=1703936 RepID=UPI000A579A9F|nr:GIY-YIG nuclease family protein [Micromonospora sp. TSRI0369]